MTADAEGRTYWGDRVPESEWARRELDITDLELETRPFPSAQFRHEITEITRGPGASIDLAIRTYDPALRLPVGPQRATLLIAPGGRRLRVHFRLSPVRPGLFEGHAHLDLGAASLPLHGFAGIRHPLLRLQHQGLSHTGLLLAPLTFPILTTRVPSHHLTVEPEGHAPGRLQVRWEPVGVTAKLIRPTARRLARPRVKRAVRLVASALK